MSDKDWWRGAVIYQIYPRSYMDSNNDGIGDLNGITQKIDYIAALGVDAIWISPFFKSPMKDYGYDVADYRTVDPSFGTNEDFVKLLDEAHARNIKIVIDIVPSHTSDQHEWFQASRQNRTNDKTDWYVWADPKPDGSAPNNWQSFFGGPSWSYETRRGQYYLHNFLPEQPDLNLWNPAVQDALLEEMRFWLELGVDGFRLDAIMCMFHGQDLRDNPAADNPEPARFNIDFPTPHSMQDHVNDHIIQPGVEFSERIRALLNEYDNRMAVAEVGGGDGINLAIRYTEDDKKLQTAYHFGLLSHEPLTPAFIRSNIEEFENAGSQSWPSWAFTNHDVVRATTRWGGEGQETEPQYAKFLMALLGSLRGSTFIYQGEELGLPEAHIAFEQIQDPWGKFLYPLWQGRDGCRTPMVWDDMKPHAGFSNGDSTWLPIDPRHPALAASLQDADKASTLNFTRDFLAWRKTRPALIKGDIEFIDCDNADVLCFKRTHENERLFCAFNFTENEVTVTPAIAVSESALLSDTNMVGKNNGGAITLPPFGCYFANAR